jgi:hypothetical protein
MNDQKLIVFLDELTALSHKHGLGINPDGDLFELDADDAELSYHCDDNSHLDFE